MWSWVKRKTGITEAKKLPEVVNLRIENVRSGVTAKLDLTKADLEEIPSDVFGLTNLEELILIGNRLRVIPKELTKLPKLKRLILTGNPIKQLPDIPGLSIDSETYLRCRKGISSEHVRGLSVHKLDLPMLAAIPHLTALESLSISSQGHSVPPEVLLNLFDAIGRLTRLSSLLIRQIRLHSLPHDIRNLTTLRSLYLWSVCLLELPEWIGELRLLEVLSVTGNECKGLPNSVAALDKLKQLSLSENRLESFPDAVCRITSLESLHLDTSYPFGRLTRIPPEILNLENLKDLSVRYQPIETPPPEIVAQGVQAIKNYWRQRSETGTDYLCEAKLLIVGEPGAGKTSLAKKLLDPQYQLQPAESSTQGIEVLPWTFPSSIHVHAEGREQVLNRIFRANIWDFGGQEIYKATHQFFLTRRSVYALIADDRKEDTDFHYWLQIVELLSDGSPLLIIQNEKQDRRRDIALSSLRARFPNLKETCRVNLADNRGLPEAVRAIRAELERLPHIGTELPQTWKRVREALERDPRNHIPLDEYFEICRQHGFQRSDDKLLLSGYLHDLGICLHFQDDPILKSTVILKPKWGTGAVYHVLDDRTVFQNHGRFGPADLARIWSEPEYSGMHHELLRLMMRFQLCYQLPASDDSIAPQLLPCTAPSYDWPKTGNLTLGYEYEFMPKGIMTRLIVALNHRLADQNLVWRSGAIFQREDTRAEVIEEYPRRITVHANGSDPRSLVAIVDDHLEQIHKSFPRLKFEKYLPCNCVVCRTRPDPFLFKLSEMKDFAETSDQIQCRVSRKMVDAAALLRDLLPGAVPARQPLEARKPPEPRKVFVSYNWTDENIRLVDQIEAVLKDNGIVLRRDLNEVAYRDSIRDFMKRMAAGDAVIAILSKGYLESPYCMFELTEIAANGDLRSRIYPVIMPDANISNSIGRLGYISHWQSRIDELESALKEHSAANLPGVHQDLDDFTRYRAAIDGILNTLRDMNTLTPAQHTALNFQDIARAIEKRLAP
jgi:Leucine-rich repeat (LRR) protein/GTPase SAR1 family protein